MTIKKKDISQAELDKLIANTERLIEQIEQSRMSGDWGNWEWESDDPLPQLQVQLARLKG